jgi:uncharacterized membrane protein
VGASATLAASVVLTLVYLVATRGRGLMAALDRGRSLLPFAPAVLLFGLSYVALFEAFYRGRVSVVAPTVATESLFGVLIAALVVGRSEAIGRRVIVGAVLIVAGGALIGAFR